MRGERVMHPQTERLIEVAGDGFREAARIADAHRVLATASATRHRVLVVDQDVRVRTLLLRALLDRGHAAAAADGLARLTRSPYRRFRWCVAFVDVTGRARPPDGELRELVGSDAAVVLVTADPAADLTERRPDAPVLKPLFVRDWLRLMDARCARHRPPAA
jgi:CheY-like chemotaxis protein